MKKITKNLLITFGSVASITAPVVSVISCGDSSPQKADPNKTDTGEYSPIDNKLHYTSKYINEHSDKFYGPAKVLENAFRTVALPSDFKLPSTISILGDGAFASAVFPENCKEDFSGIISFESMPFGDTILPKSYNPSPDSHGGGGLMNAILYEGFKYPSFSDLQNYDRFWPQLPAGLVWFDENGNQVPDRGHDTQGQRLVPVPSLYNKIQPKASWTVGKPKI